MAGAGNDGGEYDESWLGSRDLDNSHLPFGDKVAILLVGLTRSVTPALMLPTLSEHVVQGLGENHVHVFIHTCARDLSPNMSKAEQAMERQEISNMYRELIPRQVLKAVVVTGSDYGRSQQTTFVNRTDSTPKHINLTDDIGIAGVPRFWEHPFETYPLTHLVQFQSLLDLFRLLLREEVRQ